MRRFTGNSPSLVITLIGTVLNLDIGIQIQRWGAKKDLYIRVGRMIQPLVSQDENRPFFPIIYTSASQYLYSLIQSLTVLKVRLYNIVTIHMLSSIPFPCRVYEQLCRLITW